MLSVQNLTVSINSHTILDSVSYTFESGKTYAIMGPNGSGKSTFAHSILGYPSYSVSKKASLFFKSRNIIHLSPDKRAQRGLAMTFQSPVSLQGITVFQLLRIARKGADVMELKKEIEEYANDLRISKKLLERPLNEGASGGERKKLELLQIAVLKPDCIFFDEIDTGVDVDNLKYMFQFLKSIKQQRTYIFITHYQRIFSYIRPQRVLIFNKGKIAKEGSVRLLDHIQQHGYESL